MTISSIEAIIGIVVALIGIGIQLLIAGIYIGRLEGFKDLIEQKFKVQDKRLEKHNNFILRVYELEKKDAIKEEQIKVANHRIEDLEMRG